ncbi:hypothetical protein [Sphingobium sp. Ant17]|uniref:hypothetical protein n=1 Tax=Sphingobium sp. Ant17 TaxID=1461752 RepID=UPI00044E401D|nr:hypothetical protein [Sphingobium sp. Ant17]EXS69313.1 hypothetical protein BF95_23360 [Sphingobium sp. Ant17]
MTQTIERSFATRQQAELAVERLVQEHGFERDDIFVSARGEQNSAGEANSDEAADNGPIAVSIALHDDSQVALIEAVFDELQAA